MRNIQNPQDHSNELPIDIYFTTPSSKHYREAYGQTLTVSVYISLTYDDHISN